MIEEFGLEATADVVESFMGNQDPRDDGLLVTSDFDGKEACVIVRSADGEVLARKLWEPDMVDRARLTEVVGR